MVQKIFRNLIVYLPGPGQTIIALYIIGAAPRAMRFRLAEAHTRADVVLKVMKNKQPTMPRGCAHQIPLRPSEVPLLA